MTKSKHGFTLIEVITIIMLVMIIGLAGWFVYGHRNDSEPININVSLQSTPATVEAAADNYLKSKVGDSNFNKLYAFDESKSSYANPKDSNYDFIAYHFSPMKAITDNNDVIMVQVNRDNLNEVFADAVPDCVKESSQCVFEVNKQKAITIATGKLKADDISIGWHNKNDKHAKAKGLPFVIVASSCKQNKSLFIDYRNGLVLGAETDLCAID